MNNIMEYDRYGFKIHNITHNTVNTNGCILRAWPFLNH